MFIGNNRFSKGKIRALHRHSRKTTTLLMCRPRCRGSACRSFVTFSACPFRAQLLAKALLYPGQLGHKIVPCEGRAGATGHIVVPSGQLREALIIGYPDVVVAINLIYQSSERIYEIDQKLMGAMVCAGGLPTLEHISMPRDEPGYVHAELPVIGGKQFCVGHALAPLVMRQTTFADHQPAGEDIPVIDIERCPHGSEASS
jgi:hypothetical protein